MLTLRIHVEDEREKIGGGAEVSIINVERFDLRCRGNSGTPRIEKCMTAIRTLPHCC